MIGFAFNLDCLNYLKVPFVQVQGENRFGVKNEDKQLCKCFKLKTNLKDLILTISEFEISNFPS